VCCVLCAVCAVCPVCCAACVLCCVLCVSCVMCSAWDGERVAGTALQAAVAQARWQMRDQGPAGGCVALQGPAGGLKTGATRPLPHAAEVHPPPPTHTNTNLQNRPLPRTRFSLNSSGRMFLMLDVLTCGAGRPGGRGASLHSHAPLYWACAWRRGSELFTPRPHLIAGSAIRQAGRKHAGRRGVGVGVCVGGGRQQGRTHLVDEAVERLAQRVPRHALVLWAVPVLDLRGVV
jgi:hypothetical protein